jgi:hypothetical protein
LKGRIHFLGALPQIIYFASNNEVAKSCHIIACPYAALANRSLEK